MESNCLHCGEKLLGRSDKKFCNDSCRNNYHHQLNHEQINLIRNINNILKRNRHILTTFNPEGKAIVTRQQLLNQGFNFKYFTSIYTTRDARTYYFVYDQGYLAIENDRFALVMNENR
ncbi:MAG: hypothetical protein LBM67_00190 [Lentimicrobiaceae bacterium]|jgi:hypothetical protein|nr:hypothetical protein [Lentimicrobiaceae bacterium]